MDGPGLPHLSIGIGYSRRGSADVYRAHRFLVGADLQVARWVEINRRAALNLHPRRDAEGDLDVVASVEPQLRDLIFIVDDEVFHFAVNGGDAVVVLHVVILETIGSRRIRLSNDFAARDGV